MPCIAPSSYHYHHARTGVDKYGALRRRVADVFRESRGRYGYRRVKAALGTGVSEKVIRRIMREDGLVAHVPGRRRYSSYEGEATPAPDNLVNRDFTAERPNEKWLTDTTRDQGQRRKGVPFPDDRLPRRHGRGAHGRDVAERRTGATRCRVRAAATLRPGERPVVHSDRGCHYRWPGWLERMGRHGLVRSMGAKGVQPRQRRGRGVLRPYEGPGPCISGHWEERTCEEVIGLAGEYIHWYNHSRIKQSLGWKSPVEYRTSQGLAV